MKTTTTRRGHYVDEVLLSKGDSLALFIDNEGLCQVRLYFLEIGTEYFSQSVYLFTFAPFLPYELIDIMEELADLFLLFNAFLFLVERKQLALENNLKKVTLIKIFSLFLSLQCFGQQT